MGCLLPERRTPARRPDGYCGQLPWHAGEGGEANGVMNDIRFCPCRGERNYAPLFRDAVGTDTSARDYKTTAQGCEPPAPVLGTAGKNEEKVRQ